MLTAPVDLGTLSELREIMEDEFGSLVLTYIDDCTSRLTVVHRAVERRDADEIRRSAHSLKGSSGNIGALRLRDACQRLEALAGAGPLDPQNTGAIQSLVDGVTIEFESVRQALEQALAEARPS